MAMRWSRWVATVPPPRPLPPGRPRTRSDCLALLAVDAVGLQPGGDGGEPVGFLDPQFLQPLHQRFALGEGGGDRQHRIFVDHRGRALGRHASRPSARRRARAGRRHPRRRHRAGSRKSMSAPISSSVVIRPGAGRVHQHVLDDDVGARHDQRGDQREGGGGRVARHVDVAAGEPALALRAGWCARRRRRSRPRARRRSRPASFRCGRASSPARSPW